MRFSDLKSNDIWQKGHNILTEIQIDGLKIDIKNIRNMNHVTLQENYFDASYNLNDIKEINLISIPFGFKKIISHLMLEYVFEGGDSLILSIEARRKQGETFSPFKGCFNHYGLIYIWGTHNDLVGLRKEIRGNNVIVYPLNMNVNQAQRSFIYFSQQTNLLIEESRFYNTFFSNCSSNLWNVFTIRRSGLPKKTYHLFLNSRINKYLEKLGYISTKNTDTYE